VGSETPNDASDRDLFNAATRVTIGNGVKASFWSSSWLHGAPPKDLAPLIFKASKRKNRTVQDALAENNWISDIAVDAFSVEHIEQYVRLWDLLADIQLRPDTEDAITWSLTSNGCYSASSAYKIQFLASLPCQFGHIVWKTWAPQSAAFSPGSRSKIAYGPLTDWPNVDGHITLLASSAAPPLRQLVTFSL
jgi:hypothetical protein